MNNEPVAWIGKNELQFGFTETTVTSEKESWDDIPLYTHPAKEQYKFGVDWSKDGNAVTVLKIYEGGVAEVVLTDYQEVTHPAKTLTDEEIYACFHQYFALGEPKPTHYELEYEDLIEFARAILKKASEK